MGIHTRQCKKRLSYRPDGGKENHMFELDTTYDYYTIRQPQENGKYLYVSNYRNGKYYFTTDYLYAKAYTKKTATMHKDTLNERS